jgi:hypothetical protein
VDELGGSVCEEHPLDDHIVHPLLPLERGHPPHPLAVGDSDPIEIRILLQHLTHRCLLMGEMKE